MRPPLQRIDYNYAKHVGRLCHDIDDVGLHGAHFYTILECFAGSDDSTLYYEYYIMQDDGQEANILTSPVTWFHDTVVFTWIENGEIKREVIKDP